MTQVPSYVPPAQKPWQPYLPAILLRSTVPFGLRRAG